MTYYVSSGTLNSTNSTQLLTSLLAAIVIFLSVVDGETTKKITTMMTMMMMIAREAREIWTGSDWQVWGGASVTAVAPRDVAIGWWCARICVHRPMIVMRQRKRSFVCRKWNKHDWSLCRRWYSSMFVSVTDFVNKLMYTITVQRSCWLRIYIYQSWTDHAAHRRAVA